MAYIPASGAVLPLTGTIGTNASGGGLGSNILPGGAGTLNVSGVGTVLAIGAMGSNLVVGQGRDNTNDNTGRLNILSGAEVNVKGQNTYIGFYDNDVVGATKGVLTVDGGTLRNTTNANSNIVVGGWNNANVNNFGRGELEVKNNGTVLGVNMFVGAGGGNGTVTQSGGTVTLSGFFTTSAGGTLKTATNGNYNLSGGVLNVGGALSVHEAAVAGSTAASVFTQTGGTVNANGTGGNHTYIGRAAIATTKGTYDISSGIFNQATADVRVGAVGTGANGELKVSGTAQFNVGTAAASTASLWVGQSGNSVGVVNQTGGEVTIAATSANGVQLGGTAGANGTYNLNGGVLTTPKITPSATAAATAFNLNGGTLRANGAITVATTANFTSTIGASGGTINTNANTVNWNSPLGGTGELIKTGSGTLSLGAINTYAGATSVNNGVLDITGAGSIAGNLNVLSSGTVMGSGSVSGVTTVTAGIVSPGNISSAGALTFNNNVTLDAASTFSVDITDLGNDQAKLTAASIFDAGNSTLSINFTDTTFTTATNAGDLAAATRYLIVDGITTGMFGNTTPIALGDLAILGLPAGSREILAGSTRLYVEPGSFNLVPIAPVPEPSSLAVLGMAGLALANRRRRALRSSS